jgi:DNA-binding beta-propeller fold protein YncE
LAIIPNVNKGTRRVIIYSLFGLFFVLGATTVFYAQGYRFDFGTFAVQKVGAIYVRSFPKNASLVVDGKKIDRGAMFLNSATLVPDLIPKSHMIAIDSPGFIAWKRRVAVGPSLVTEVRAILLPEKPELIRERAPIKFWALPDTPLIEFLPGLSYYGYKIPGDFYGISSDKNQILTKDALKNYYVTNLSPATTTMKSQKLMNIARGAVIFDRTPGQFISYNNTVLAFLSIGAAPTTIFTAPKGQTVVGTDSSKNLLALITLDNKNKSWLWLYEKASGNTKNIDSVPGKTVTLEFSPSGQIAMLQDSGNLYLYDPSTANISTSSSRVKSFLFSGDGTSLAVLSEKKLEIYNDNGNIKLDLALLPDIQKMYWHADNQHLFLQFSDHLGLFDLLDLQPENIQFINNSTENSYDPVSNSLYFEKDGGLYRITFPS